MLLEGKSAVVTGAGSGVGPCLRTALRRGRRPGGLRRPPLDWAKETVRQIEEAGGVAVAAECDVSQEDEVAGMIAAAVEHFGRLDIIFNNVGIPTPRLGMSFEEHTVEDFDRLVAVNLRGVFLGCKHAVIQFKKQGDGGVILNTGSVAGLVGWGGTVYGATKGGVHQITQAVRHRVRAVRHPGERDLPGGDALHRTSWPPAGAWRRRGRHDQIAEQVGAMHPLGEADHRRGLRRGRRVPRVGPGRQHHRRAPPGRRRVRRPR